MFGEQKYLDLCYEKSYTGAVQMFERIPDSSLVSKNMGVEFMKMLDDIGVNLNDCEPLASEEPLQENEHTYCICGHIIHNEFFIQDTNTEKVVKVGSCCVLKKNKKLGNKLKKNKKCLNCENFFGDQDCRKNPYKKGFCSISCEDFYNSFDSSKKFRKCKDCKAFNIERDLPTNYIRCRDCWKSQFHKGDDKGTGKCRDCDKKIKNEYVRCYDCYKIFYKI